MKRSLFLKNTKLLYDKFEIIPLLYGSLGLEYIIQESLNADDIDILIPEIFIQARWEEFKNILTECGYALVDEHEHTFQKDGVSFSYASFEELGAFAKIDLSDIEVKTEGDARFKILSLEQYLKVYTASSKDGYRINVRKKKDADKILFIQKHINN